MRFSFEFKFVMFLLLGVVCALIGGNFGFVGSEEAVSIIRHFGYWMILATVIVWVIAGLRAYPSVLRKEGWQWLRSPTHRWGIVLVLSLFVLIQFQEEKGFKILLDEPVLMNTSRMMHFDREVMVVSNSHRVDGILAAQGYVDKRPNFFPFLVSVVHDLTGYRVENAFYLNAILLLVFLGLTYAVTTQLGGNIAGLISVGLVGSVPLIWHQSAGGGFEILNLVMILLTIKMAIDYLNNPSEKLLSALVLTAVMLSHVRYEGALFIIPVGIIVLMGYSINKKGMLPLGMCLAPVLLIPLLWQMRVFDQNPRFWELFTVDKAKPFSLDYIPENMMNAIYFFFEWIKQQPNAPLVAWIGWIGTLAFIIFMLMRCIQKEKREVLISKERSDLVLLVFSFGFMLYGLLLMSYAFDLGRYMVVRLALPLFLFISITSAVFCGGWLKNRMWHKIILGVVALGFVSWTIPSASSGQFASLYFPAQEAKIIGQFIEDKQNANERFLAVADLSMLWTAYDVEALPSRAINGQLSKVKYFIEQPNNVPVYVMQSMVYVPHLHRYAEIATDPLDDRLLLEPFFERHISTFRILRISRLVDILDTEPLDDTDLFDEDAKSLVGEWLKNMP